MIDRILVRYGDLTLKGRNKKRFIDTAVQRVQEKMTSERITLERAHDRLYVRLNGEDPAKVVRDLKTVSGLRSFSLVHKVEKDMDALKKGALDLLQEEIDAPTTFKVETKRADKSFPLTSPEISKEIAGHVIPRMSLLEADVHNPAYTLNVEIRAEGAYLYCGKVEGLGGYPVGSMGKGLMLLSGGIDSAVAGFLSQRKGIETEHIHFESTPMTPIESVDKAIELTERLATYAKKNRILLHIFPLFSLHEAILQNVPEPYHIAILRRMMVRVADNVASQRRIPVLITGESVGQVASQTLTSLHVTDHAATRPILRPLATYDKEEIIRIAERIKTFEISIRPYEDCCQVYVPKSPVTNPRDYYAKRYEGLFDYQGLIDEALRNMVTLTVGKKSGIRLSTSGFSVKEAVEEGGIPHDRFFAE